MITIEAQGIQYEKVLSVECGGSLGAIARDFSITVARPNNRPLPFKGGEKVKIRIDGELFLDGFIYIVSPGYSKKTHTVTLTGRSKAGNFVDSGLFPFALTGSVTLEAAIQHAIDQIGLDLKAINTVKDLEPFNEAEDKIVADVGENAFAFADKLAKKRQTLLTSDAVGNIIIARTGTEQVNVSLRNIIGGSSNNIIDGIASYDLSGRFSKYAVLSQLNETAGSQGGEQDPEASTDQRAEAIDSEIQKLGLKRQFVQKAEKRSSNEQCQSRATWQGNIKRAKYRTYRVIVKGVRPEGGSIWDTNKLIQVNDEYASVNEIMLIDSVRFSQSRSGGTRANLGLVDKDAYSLSLKEPPPAKRQDNSLVD